MVRPSRDGHNYLEGGGGRRVEYSNLNLDAVQRFGDAPRAPRTCSDRMQSAPLWDSCALRQMTRETVHVRFLPTEVGGR